MDTLGTTLEASGEVDPDREDAVEGLAAVEFVPLVEEEPDELGFGDAVTLPDNDMFKLV